MDKNWKRAERELAKLFGTVRIPPAVFGQRPDRGDNAPDAETPLLALQCKDGYSFPAYLRAWLGGICKNAPAGKTGVVIWHPRGSKFTESLALLRASDLAALVQALPASGSPPDSLPDTPGDN